MKKIPIKQAEGFAIANGLKQVIIFGHDGTNTHIVTWGDTVENSAQAAAGANHVKKLWGWPATDVVESAKVQALRDELAATQRDLAAVMEELRNPKNDVPMKPSVHIIEGTEHERGWGCRPDGYVAFLSKAEAEAWMADYSERNHTAKHAPDEYTSYAYIGLVECSIGFYKATMQRKLKHFNRRSELLE